MEDDEDRSDGINLELCLFILKEIVVRNVIYNTLELKYISLWE